MLKHLPYRLFLLALSLTSLAACSGASEDASSADDADESASLTSAESALTTELADEVTQPVSTSPANVATAASMRVGTHLKPATCLTTTVTGASVVYTMNDCTGPYGLVHLTGTVTAVYSRTTSGDLQVVITGAGLQANKSVLDLNATVTATQANGVRTARVVCNSAGTGPRGNSVSRAGEYTAVYDSSSECITVNGTWTTTAGLRSASTVVSKYTRCKGTCPAAGGSIVHTTVRSNVVTVTYDGSATASWSTSGGKSGTVALVCAAN
jgi:hypothetical protein